MLRADDGWNRQTCDKTMPLVSIAALAGAALVEHVAK